jgi:hypothetical protein
VQIETMPWADCPNCPARLDLFGDGGDSRVQVQGLVQVQVADPFPGLDGG